MDNFFTIKESINLNGEKYILYVPKVSATEKPIVNVRDKTITFSIEDDETGVLVLFEKAWSSKK